MAMNLHLGNRLRDLRCARGWTQERLADELNVTRQRIIRMEAGADTPDSGMLARMAELYDMTVDEMLADLRRDAPQSAEDADLAWLRRCYPVLCTAAFLALGLYCRVWGYAWLVFLTIPLFYSAIPAGREKNRRKFAYPVLALLIFLILGFAGHWSWCWAVFLTVPLYYAGPKRS